ncbi:MAG: hypothetical protein ACUZ9M_08700 [Candidatus Scalindua sp.]
MQITLNAPDSIPKAVLQEIIKEFENILEEEAKILSTRKNDDTDELNFNAAVHSPKVRKLLAQLSQKL